MAARFPGFPQQGLTFLQELKENNTREWFTPRKAVFDESVKAPMVALVEAMNAELASFAPDYLTEPAKAVYRIYRDTRFSNDKTPYKTHIAANFHKQGADKHAAAGYYFSVGADQIELAAGVYMPGPEELLRLRQHISGQFAEFSKLAGDKAVAKLVGPLQGESLARPPKGFAADDPAIEWIKKKQWHYYATDLDLAVALTPKLLPELVKRLKAMTPMVTFLNRGLTALGRYAFILPLLFSFAAGGQPAKYRQGHSHMGEGFNEGPRQKPWDMAGIGRVSFPITHKHAETQKWFNQGVALLHSFWYYEAERSFRWCLQLEPENAMAWWGLARSQAGGKRGKEFLQEAVKRKGGVSERERMYIESDAATALPELGEKAEEHRGRQILERLAMKYPDDLEAKTFLALDMMGDARMGAELLIREVLAKAPDHPGAHHYRIHNWDGNDPEFALVSCRRYSEVAPAIGHAVHMPGHVYAGAGMWHEAAIAMDAATRVEKKYMQDRQTFPFENWNYPHNKNYLAYIQAQLGMEKAALSAGRQLLAAPRMEKENRRSDAFPLQMEAQIILLRTYVRFGRWKELLNPDQFEWDTERLGNRVQKPHVEALAHLGLGDAAKARKALDELEALKEEVTKKDDYLLKSWYPVMVREVKGKLLLGGGKTLEGLTELGEAAQAWGAMLRDQNDPPFYPSNIYDDLGRAYLTAKSPALAATAYGKSLELVRNNAWALAGLAEAHSTLGEKEKATAFAGRLLHVWGDADAPPAATGKAVDVSPGPQRNYKKTTLASLGPDEWTPFAAQRLDALDPHKKRVTLEEYAGRNVVLIFYLGQECAHCLEQLQAVAKRKDDFEKRNTAVLAMSSNKPEDNADSLQIKSLPIRLLSDERFENAKRYLSYDDFERLELHSTILIDAKGRVRWAQRGGDPFTDFDRLLKEIDRVNKMAE